MPSEDAQVLLGAANCLITDYSSCFFDYMIREKPIIHYIYDYEYYRNKDRGLYYDLADVVCGSVAYNVGDLIKAIEDNILDDVEKDRRTKMREKFVTYESSTNCKRVIDEIFKHIKKGKSLKHSINSPPERRVKQTDHHKDGHAS